MRPDVPSFCVDPEDRPEALCEGWNLRTVTSVEVVVVTARKTQVSDDNVQACVQLDPDGKVP